MGKKRSKTAKQKQARAKGGTSRKFGVSVRKGGGREQPSSQKVVMDAIHNKHQQQQQQPRTKGIHNDNNNRLKKNNHKTKRKEWKDSKSISVDTSERDDFERQMRSLQERTRSSGSVRQNGKTSSSMITTAKLSFAAPAFVLDDKDKSTEQLMDETALKIERGLQGIGQQQQQQQRQINNIKPFQPSNRLQVLAAQWSVDEPSPLESNNPYAVLDNSDNDDDEEETTVTSNVQKTHPFQFAQPVFIVPTMLTTTTTTTVSAMMDPDL